MIYSCYYGYLPDAGGGEQNTLKLLAVYNKIVKDDWFKPYNDRTWDQGLFKDKQHDLTEYEQGVVRLAGYDPDRIRALEIPYTIMERENIVAIAPDPKLPPAAIIDWLPYPNDKDSVKEVMASFGTHNSSFGQLVQEVQSLQSKDRFKGVLDATQLSEDTAICRTAIIFKDRNPAKEYEEHLLALADSALPPNVPPHSKDWPNTLPRFASDREGWQFKLLFGLIDLFHSP